jgi:6-phosphogluconate dehydrogenase
MRGDEMKNISIGLIGLGKMGGNLGLNLMEKGWSVTGYNRSPDKSKLLEEQGLKVVYSIEELVSSLSGKRVFWLMVPQGKPVDDTIESLLPYLNTGDIIIDGGNSKYTESMARYKTLKEKGLNFVDIGTSGGIKGARNGACMMVGGESDSVEILMPILESVCVKDGVSYMGAPGAGHFVKMIHNGIEYGMMQAIGEGFEVLEASEFDLNYEKVAKVWNNGSIITGYLMEMTQKAFEDSETLAEIDSVVDASGEGLWTVETALSLKVPVPVIMTSLNERYRTKKKDSFSAKVVAAQRNQFGGHKLHKR